MMQRWLDSELPAWLRFTICGADPEGDEGSGDSGDGEGDPLGDGGGEGGGDGDGEGEGGSGDPDDKEELKEALRKERIERKKHERAAKKLQREKDEGSQEEEKDLQKTREENGKLKENTGKLATKLREREVTAAIEKAARDANFIDTDDAIKGIDRSLIDVDQDDEDPSVVDVDLDSVKAAVKKLATAKKHLIKVPAPGTKSGSTFSGSGGSGGDGKPTDQTLVDKYPALQH